MSPRPRPWARLRLPLLGAAAAVYLGAYLLTLAVGRHPVRPLFEGIGPPPPYRWVTPPAAFQASNSPPAPSTQAVQLGPAGNPQVGVVSEDSQLVLNLPAGAVPAATGNTTAAITTVPLDPARLGNLPAGLFADGNAYRVTVTYRPSNRQLTSLALGTDVVMTTPAKATVILFSPDGTTWQRLATSQVGSTTVAASFRQPGIFLAAATIDVLGTPGKGPSHQGSVVVVALIVGAVAVILVAAPLLWLRRRR